MMEKEKNGVVADDITGGNDIGVMLAKNGYRAVAVSLQDGPRGEDFEGADALIVNTASRLCSAAEAAERSRRAAETLLALGCGRLYTKTCSAFRGNIGAALDAVQDAAGVSCSMVVAGYPRNGRTTLHGLHYVQGQPLAESPFRNDPVNPMTESRLGRIIARQSSRPWAEFPFEWLDEPEESRRARLEELKQNAAYVIFDVRDQRDLETIARLIRDEKNICGASAIGEELPKAWGCAGAPVRLRTEGYGPEGVLIVSGSLTPQTLAQTAFLRERGVPWVTLSGQDALGKDAGAAALEAAEEACAHLRRGSAVLLQAEQDPSPVRAAAARLGLDPQEAGRRISRALGQAARMVRAGTGVSRILVAGGETSDAVSAALEVRAMEIGQEIEPGVPLMAGKTARGEQLLLVFKSGSFGSDGFLYNAAAQMRP